MTLTALAPLIGRSGLYRPGAELAFPVTVLDVKRAWGVTRYLIEPQGGSGASWVGAEKVTLSEEPIPAIQTPA